MAPRTTARANTGGAHDVSPFLDVFMQRHLILSNPSPSPGLVSIAPYEWHSFLVNLLPSPLNLVSSLDKLYNDPDGDGALSPQKRANIVITLASGALCNTDTTTGEKLFVLARQQNALNEDAVSLEAVQFWLLTAECQLNMGLVTPAYLEIGSACRKAAAMGLIGARGCLRGPEAHAEQGRVTAWALYHYDCCYSIMGGRTRIITLADIAHERPDGQVFLANLYQLTSLLEEIAALVNEDKTGQLHDLFKLVGEVHIRLVRWAEGVDIGTMTGLETPTKATAALLLHYAYFQVIQYAFRPFIVVEYVLSDPPQETDQLWLRQACRLATDAAADGITYFQAISQKLQSSEFRRRDAWFLESSSSMLLLESLRRPTKHEHNSVYVQKAMEVLKTMPSLTPVTTLLASIKSIAGAMEKLVDARKHQRAARILSSGANGTVAGVSSRAVDELAPPQEDEVDQEMAITDQESSFMTYLSQTDLGAGDGPF